MTAVGPLSLNILAPAMPGLIVTFGADAGAVQLTLSLFLFGMAISQIVLGPLSDRFGRRPVTIAGLALTVVAAALVGWGFARARGAAATPVADAIRDRSVAELAA